MREFEIEFKDKGHNDFIAKSRYSVKSIGFEAIIGVLHFTNEQAFVHEYACAEGSKLLECFTFWNELQIKVLKFHNNLKTKTK